MNKQLLYDTKYAQVVTKRCQVLTLSQVPSSSTPSVQGMHSAVCSQKNQPPIVNSGRGYKK